MQIENVLQNYDEFTHLKALQTIDLQDEKAVNDFKERYFLTDENIEEMKGVQVLSERVNQDYRSTYNDIREWIRTQKESEKVEDSR